MPGKKVLKELERIVGAANITADPADLSLYSYDATNNESLPDCVVFPDGAGQVSEILKIASAERVPVVPRGAGSGMSGGSIPVKGGIVLSLTRMNRILEISREDMVCRAEAGAVTGEIASAVAREGLYYPPDPSSLNFCTIGGNIAHNAGGLHAVKYGVTKNWLLGLIAVLPDGEVLKTGVRTMKGVVGYDLTRLICGSEGTLAVVTEVTLKLIPQPASRAVAVAAFPGAVEAGAAVSSIMSAKILPAMLEFMDNTAVRCVEGYIKAGLPVDAGGVLLVELDGHPEAVKAEMATAVAIMEKHGASGIRHSTDQTECERLWQARRSVAPSLGRVSPRRVSEDITVPRSAIPEALKGAAEIGRRHDITMAVFGHAGDGNLHVNMLIDQRDPVLKPRIEAAVKDVMALAIRLNGTISGEHGVGITKQRYIGMEIGPGGLAVLRKIKQSFDPNNILNPGKILPVDEEAPQKTGA
jgi:glycolate oxidase